jgi:hypothetical protein
VSEADLVSVDIVKYDEIGRLYIYNAYCCDYRLSINSIDLVLIPTKRGKDNSRSDGHCLCEKRWKTICWRVNKYLKYNHLLLVKNKHHFVYK